MLEELSKEDVLISDVSDIIGDEKSEDEEEAHLEVEVDEDLKEEAYLEVVDEVEEKEVLEEKAQN